MSITLSGIEISFDRAGGDEARRREIVRNIENILLTPVGTDPLYRDFVEVIDAIEKWEPRVRVRDVSFVPDPSGSLGVKVVIGSG